MEEQIDRPFDEHLTLPINEIFFSLEGEGTRIGEPTIFVRLQGCPFHCSYCDTEYARSMDADIVQASRQSLNNIISTIRTLKFKHNFNKPYIEFTGGSPDLYADELLPLLKYYNNLDWPTVLQVSGGLYQDECFIYATIRCIDYKDPREQIPFVVPVEILWQQDEIKFLITDDESYAFVAAQINALLERGFPGTFIITGVTPDDVPAPGRQITSLRTLTDKILNDDSFPKSHIKIIPRLHCLLWDNKQGK